MFGRPIDETTQDEERQAQEEDVEDRLLNQCVEEDGGRIDREAEPGDETRLPREQTFGGQPSIAQDRAPTIAWQTRTTRRSRPSTA